MKLKLFQRKAPANVTNLETELVLTNLREDLKTLKDSLWTCLLNLQQEVKALQAAQVTKKPAAKRRPS